MVTEAIVVYESFENSVDSTTAATLTVAQALFQIASALQSLGVGNASTDMGALENLAAEVKTLGETLGVGLDALVGAQSS